MSAAALPRLPRITLLAVALSAVAGAFAAYALLPTAPVRLPSPTVATGPQLTVPAGWHRVSRAGALAVRRDDGRGLVAIRRTTPVALDAPRLVHDLGTRLRARFPGFHLVSARFARLRGGRAFVYTFERDPNRVVQTIAFTGSYEIDATVTGGAKDAAREAGAIVSSFGG